jgi:sec-independent protein translocase protein TatA
MRNFGMGELIVVLLLVLLLFGARKLPDLARSLGRSLNEFKKGKEEGLKPESEQKKNEGAPQKPEEKK